MCFIHWDILKIQIILWQITPYFWNASYQHQRMPMGLNISSVIWQCYINAILDCLWSGKYCEDITDTLLLFAQAKKSHIAKQEDLLKALLKMDWKYPNNCLLFRKVL